MNKWKKHALLGICTITMGAGIASSPTPLTVEASSVSTYQTTANVNLRTGASTQYKRILTVPKGKQVKYLGKSGNWLKVKYGSKTGYLHSHYAKKKYTSTAKATVKSAPKLKTTANLNLRKGASIHHKRILTIPKGKQVSVISKSGTWSKVKYGSKTGHVSSRYLQKSQTATTQKTTPAKNGYTKKVMDVEVTAYTFGYGANLTASGKKLQVGHVSAPREIPFGSVVDIPGIEKQLGVSELKVYDRGGAIKRLSANKIRIDVAFPTRAQALQFGRKTYKNVPVYIKK